MTGRRKSRNLSEEEARLWALAMRDTAALKRRGEKAAEQSLMPPEQTSAQLPAAQQKSAAPAPARQPPPAPPPQSAQSESPLPLTGFGRRQVRQIVKGQHSIDARLDLHGMRQREAFTVLRSFLFRSQAEGHRHVLIITGKGTGREAADDFFWAAKGQGVLRRLVPQWLQTPELGALIISYGASHLRHGGEGALYVKLRRLK